MPLFAFVVDLPTAGRSTAALLLDRFFLANHYANGHAARGTPNDESLRGIPASLIRRFSFWHEAWMKKMAVILPEPSPFRLCSTAC